MNSPVNQIKESLGIEEVVSSYMKLEPAGSNLKAKCPFHNEKTPSFFVSPNRGSYYCFGCGASGDIFTFVEEFEGLDFKGALRLLAGKAGVILSSYKIEDQKNKGEKDRLYEAIEESTSYFENNLKENKEALEYLKERGLNDQSIKNFNIGFIKDDWRLLYSYLKNKGFTDNEMEKAGLVKKTEKGFYDRFRGRIMFPISDTSGRVIAFSGRLFESVPTPEGVGKPTSQANVGSKYLNSPDTPIFSKSAILYGLDKAKESIRKNNFSILVEGQMDLILSHQVGYKNTIATSGTALSDSTISKENLVSNLGLIRRLSPNIVLAFDADNAGFKASNRAGRIALSLGMDVKVASIPKGVDPADLISAKDKLGSDAWRSAIRDSKHIIEFLLDKILKDFQGDARKVGREVKDVVLPYVDALESSIEKMHFIKKISDISSIPENALKDDLKKIEQEFKYEKKEIEETEESLNKMYRKDYILRKLLSIILWQKSIKVPTPKGVGIPTESVGKPNIDVDIILKEITEILNITRDEVLKKTKENKEDLIFEAEVFYGGLPAQIGDMNLEKDIEELLGNLKEESLKEELFKKMQELRIVEEKKPASPDTSQGGDMEKANQVLKEISEINNKIQNIKNNRFKK